MPLTYEIRRPILLFVANGDMEYNETLTVLKQGLEAARRCRPGTPGWDLIFDVRKSTQTRSTEERRGIAMALAQQTDLLTGRLAVVVADDRYEEVLRAFKSVAELLRHEPRIFHELEDAEAWLKAERTQS